MRGILSTSSRLTVFVLCLVWLYFHRLSRKPFTAQHAEKLFLYVIPHSDRTSLSQTCRSIPDAASARATSRRFALEPHLAGSRQDFHTATSFLSILQHQLAIRPPHQPPVFPAGSPHSQHATLSIPELRHPTAWIDVYYPVLDTPLDRRLDVLAEDGEVLWRARLEEEADDTDPQAGRYSEAVPTWHGLSHHGQAVGRLVRANYGTKEDYDDLLATGEHTVLQNLIRTLTLDPHRRQFHWKNSSRASWPFPPRLKGRFFFFFGTIPLI
jgi:hypothetical protein